MIQKNYLKEAGVGTGQRGPPEVEASHSEGLLPECHLSLLMDSSTVPLGPKCGPAAAFGANVSVPLRHGDASALCSLFIISEKKRCNRPLQFGLIIHLMPMEGAQLCCPLGGLRSLLEELGMAIVGGEMETL